MSAGGEVDLVRAMHASTALGFGGPGRRPPPSRAPACEGSAEGLWRAPSVRAFADPSPACAEVEEVLSAAYGDRGGRRNVPSAGAIYGFLPHAIWLHCGALARFGGDGRLTLQSPPLPPDAVAAAFFHQLVGPAVVVVLIADVERYVLRYGPRGYRYVLLEAGHAAQEITRRASAASLAACPLGAFDDGAIEALLGLRIAGFLPVYALALGHLPQRGG